MSTKILQLFSTKLFYLVFISCFGPSVVNSAPLVDSPARNELNIHLDQHLDQTEAEPDLSQPQPTLQPAPAANSSHTSSKPHKAFSAIDFVKERYGRQDVGQAVGDRVGTIVSGVLGGGLGNIFEGSTSFIGNVNAQEEVDFVLNNVAPPFETILKYGYEGIKKYFGIGQTTVKPQTQTLVITQPPEQKIYLQPVVYDNGTVEYIPIYHTVTKPPIVLTITNPPVEDSEFGDINNNANANDYDIVAKYPLLEYSRVDRLH